MSIYSKTNCYAVWFEVESHKEMLPEMKTDIKHQFSPYRGFAVLYEHMVCSVILKVNLAVESVK